MKITSQPVEVVPDEAAARFTRATELLMRAAERRKSAQAAFPTTPRAPIPQQVVKVPFVPAAVLHRVAAGTRMTRRGAIQRGGHA